MYNKLSVIHVLHTVTPDIQKLNTFETVSTSATSWSLQMCLLKGLMHWVLHMCTYHKDAQIGKVIAMTHCHYFHWADIHQWSNFHDLLKHVGGIKDKRLDCQGGAACKVQCLTWIDIPWPLSLALAAIILLFCSRFSWFIPNHQLVWLLMHFCCLFQRLMAVLPSLP